MQMKAKGFLLNVAGCLAGLVGELIVWVAVHFLLYDVLAKSKIFSTWFSLSMSLSGTVESTNRAFVRISTLVILGCAIAAGINLCKYICRFSDFQTNWGCIAFSVLSALWLLFLTVTGVISNGFTMFTVIYPLAAVAVMWFGYTASQE